MKLARYIAAAVVMVYCCAGKPDDSAIFREQSYLMGKVDFVSDSRFVKLNSAWSNGTIYLRVEAAEAFGKMRSAALKDGISLTVVSGARTFDRQKTIWERKWNDAANKHLAPDARTLKCLQYSAMPGASRHHWGTDMDLNSVEPSYFEAGVGLKIYEWLVKNGPEYGFCQVYTDKKGGRTGYEMERWHWSYMPVSREVLKRYNELITAADLTGFAGSESAAAVKIIENYVNGIEDNGTIKRGY